MPLGKKGFRKTSEDGTKDPNIMVQPRGERKLTRRELKDRELLMLARKLKPHVADALMTAVNIMKDEKAGWLLLLIIFIDMMLFDGRLLTNLLTI